MSRLSGVKAFTIRVWEKRYHALDPDRSEGNTRFYNNNQLRRLLNVVSLMQLGHKASKLCSLSDKALFQLIEEKTGQPSTDVEGFFISQLIAAGFTYDESHFTNLFAQCLARFGVRNTYTTILYPMLQRIGILWNSDRINPANEHFITNLIRQKILTATDLLASPAPAADTWLLFLPEGEFHEIGLLIAHYLIRLSGRRSVYLGANLPLDALAAASSFVRPDNILLFLVCRNFAEDNQTFLRSLTASVRSKRIYMAGAGLSEKMTASKRVMFLESVEELEKLLSPD